MKFLHYLYGSLAIAVLTYGLLAATIYVGTYAYNVLVVW